MTLWALRNLRIAMMQIYCGQWGYLGMRSNSEVRLIAGVVLALAAATTVAFSLVFFSIQPASLSAAMPPGVIASESE